jgi:hypothetical protein
VNAANPQLHIAMLERELQWAHLEIQVLEKRQRRQRISFLGPHSETQSDLQQELLVEEEPSVTGEKWKPKHAASRSPSASASRIPAGSGCPRICHAWNE